MGDYFHDYMNTLDELKLPYKRIVVESENPVDKNAIYIKKELDKIDGKVLVISHSKGGLEFLEVLVNHPEMANRVVGWVSMQSPYRGSVLADYFLEGTITNNVMGWLFSILGGEQSGLSSVGTDERVKYMKDNHAKINKILGELNYLQFITYINDLEGRETLLEISRNFILDRAGKNDGMVDLKSSLLENYRHIIINDVDHLATVLDQGNLEFIKDENESWRFDRKKHFRALIHLILEGQF